MAAVADRADPSAAARALAGWRRWPDAKKRALLDRLSQLAYEKARLTWRPYPWQRPHLHPEDRPAGPCDETCEALPTATVASQGTWLMLGGRGTGKTDGCARYMDDHVHGPPCDPRVKGGHRMTIIAPTLGDAVDACVEGPSGLKVHNPRVKLRSTPGGTKVVWPSGAEARLMGAYTPEDVERLRAGGNRCLIWLEEVAAMRRLDDAIEHSSLGLRVGPAPHFIASTTPKPRPQIKKLRDDPNTILTSGRTSAAWHLAQSVKDALYKRFLGTRKGRQELDGVLMEEVEGALWSWGRLDKMRTQALPGDLRYVVGVDPAASNTEESDETGIVVCAATADRTRGWVVEDLSGRYDPEEWAQLALGAMDRWGADYIVAERNQGGDMVRATLRAVDPTVRLKTVWASKGKRLRAEPVSVFYEQGRVQHAGVFVELEEQMTTWVPEDEDSPDRLDALVYALTDLMMPPERRGGSVSAA